MTEKTQLALIQLAGFGAVLIGCGLALAATVYAPALPAIGIALASAVSWYVGKLVATPLAAVTMKAVASLPPAATAELVTRIATSSSSAPPPLALALAFSSLAPAAQQQIQIILDDEASHPPPPLPPPLPPAKGEP